MCSECSGDYQEHEDGDENDVEESSSSDFAAASNRSCSERNRNQENLNGPAAMKRTGAQAAGSGYEENYDVLVGADQIIEVRVIRARCSYGGHSGMVGQASRGNVHDGVGRQPDKYDQTRRCGALRRNCARRLCLIGIILLGLTALYGVRVRFGSLKTRNQQ